MMPSTTIHWFRRDLRLDDNTGLNAAIRGSSHLLPLFILDETLLHTSRGGGGMRVGFLLESLTALDEQLRQHGSRLVIRRGQPTQVLSELAQATGARRITYNRDYSPYARQRDPQAEAFLRGLGLTVESYPDLVMHEFDEVLNQEKPLHVFTPYRKRWETLPKPAPQALLMPLPSLPPDLDAGPLPTLADLNGQAAPQAITQAGELQAQRQLAHFIEHGLAAYADERNNLDKDGTSILSPHLRWGSLSIRRCYQAASQVGGKGAEVWISELVWREFYQMILAWYPQVLKSSFRPQYDAIPWENNEDWFGAWCEGRTGYPVVDAAMRQLRQTGWMHNRARMIVASFLCKDLLIDWRWGERYFMQYLLDGDSAANNGGWQWTAGTGTDAAPYFRIFNPISQGQKFDPDGHYIQRWIPELADLPTEHLHTPWLAPTPPAYPAPIVDHALQRDKALALYGVTKNT
jgi:deoxyribodipyrimidine photo-lyase